jgi:hypothetical protein
MEIQGFCGGMYKGRSFAIDGQECVNFYPENNGPYANGGTCLIGTPGTVLYQQFLNEDNSHVGANRGFYTTAADRFFAVIGNALFEIYADNTYQLRGNLKTFTGKVSIAENQGSLANQLMVVDGLYGYIIDLDTNAFQQITDSDYVSGSFVCSLDGYFLQQENNSQKIFFTTDGLTWDALDFFSAESSPDNISAIIRLNSEIVVFGSKAIEFWYNSGATADLPFSRVNNAIMEVGLEAANSVDVLGSSAFFLGANNQGHGTVWMTQGYQLKDISTHAIEYIIAQISKDHGVSDAIGYCYQDEGHSFYVLSFPAGNRTLVYDVTTDLWHERGYWNERTGVNDMHRGICHAFWRGKNYVGDYANSNIYYYDLDVFTDNTNVIKRVRSTRHLANDRKRLFFNEIEFDIERGTGLQTGQGSEPKIMMQLSNDGGASFGNEIWLNTGAVGKRLTRARKSRLGMARDRVFKITCSDPVKWIFTGARLSVESE